MTKIAAGIFADEAMPALHKSRKKQHHRQ